MCWAGRKFHFNFPLNCISCNFSQFDFSSRPFHSQSVNIMMAHAVWYYYVWAVLSFSSAQLSSTQFCSKAKENKHKLFSRRSDFAFIVKDFFLFFLCIEKTCKHMFKCSMFILSKVCIRFHLVNINFDFSMSFCSFLLSSFLSFQAVGCCRRSQAF